jgi:hypothetical protein
MRKQRPGVGTGAGRHVLRQLLAGCVAVHKLADVTGQKSLRRARANNGPGSRDKQRGQLQVAQIEPQIQSMYIAQDTRS